MPATARLRIALLIAFLFLATGLPTAIRAADQPAPEIVPTETLLLAEVTQNAVVGPPIGEAQPDAAGADQSIVVEPPATPPAIMEDIATLPLQSRLPAATGAQAYVIADVLFLQRDNQSTDQLLAASAGDAVLTTGQLQFPTQPALRLFYGSVNDSAAGWEIGYLGVWSMFGSRTAGGPDDVQAADPLALLVPEFNGRSTARATYGSTLNSIEINTFTRAADGGYCRTAAEPWRRCNGYCRGTFDWLAGFRWAGLDEQAALAFGGSPASLATGYAVRTSSNLFGGQLGVRGRADLQAWAVEGWVKAALAGSMLAQSQDPIIDSITGDVYRSARGSRTQTPGGIFDVGATLVYRLSDTWGLRFGYSMLWLTNVALAPDQFDFTADTEAGTRLDGNQTLWLGGANLGLEARW